MGVGEAVNPGITEAIREEFYRKDIFTVKVTRLIANKVLLQDLKDGAMQA